MELNLKQLMAIEAVFGRLNSMQRWSSFVGEDKYNEQAKQALNCIVAYLLSLYVEENGTNVDYTRFPKIAIYRAFQKVYVYYDVPENIINQICAIGDIKKDMFNLATRQIITEKTDERFCNFLSEGLGTNELRIYRAATKVATYVELLENQVKMNGEYLAKLQEIIQELEEFMDVPGVAEMIDSESPMSKLLLRISKLRHQNRWAVNLPNVKCSVLAHLFDTAVLAYWMSLEENFNNQNLAAQRFFMGIFHDLAEVWTKDIPSPIKDRIPGFRAATEVFEEEMLEKHLYKVISGSFSEQLKHVMFEEEENATHKAIMKGADYLSAASECHREYLSGTRVDYYVGAVDELEDKIASGKAILTPIAYELYLSIKQDVAKIKQEKEAVELYREIKQFFADQKPVNTPEEAMLNMCKLYNIMQGFFNK